MTRSETKQISGNEAVNWISKAADGIYGISDWDGIDWTSVRHIHYHFIAFKLLALIRDRVFGALRRLCPAKLEGKGKGNLTNVITSDIELLEVFYAHAISPICIVVLFSAVMVGFVLASLRGLSETLQYGQGEQRLAQMNAKTDALAVDEGRMKRRAGRNTAATNTVIRLIRWNTEE